MRTFWAFGDSFMAYNENYIRVLAHSCNARRVRIEGVHGSGLLFTYQQLLRNKDRIKEDDVVLIGLSSPTRHLFGDDNNWHVLAAGAISDRRVGQSTHHNKIEIEQAANDYFKYLYNDNHAHHLAHAIVTSIFKSIIPSLKTQRVSVAITLDVKGYSKTFNLPEYLFNEPDLHSIAVRYLKQELNLNDEDVIRETLDTKNHWIEGDDRFYKYFFKNIPRILNDLQIDKVDYSTNLI